MPRHMREKSKSGYYHIILRGNERKNIFLDDEDKQRFIETMHERKQGNRFFLHAFCLMDNHIHIMLSEGTDDIARVMKRITVSYVYYFNKKYKRVGHLFQDRYRSEAVDSDSYILALARYIHQNPVKAGMVKSASEYKWSSYRGYHDESSYWSKMLDKDIVMGLLSDNRALFEKYMNQESNETFIDIPEEKEEMDEKEAKELYERILLEEGINPELEGQVKIPDELIRVFKNRTNLSIRKIAIITRMNKDKINRIIKT